MTVIEAAICVLLLLMALPDVCRRLRRPALLYPLYILAGVLAGSMMEPEAREFWRSLGQFGFVLLLFSVGLEIELPERRETLVALGRGIGWIALQAPAVVALAHVAGIPAREALVAAAALGSCSVGMAYRLWAAQRFPTADARRHFLQWMVALEVLAIVLLAGASPAIRGLPWHVIALQLCGIAVAIVLVGFFADRITGHLGGLLQRTLRWQVHFVVLLILVVAAIGDRFGLSAPKTAFFFGMFVSRSTHEALALDQRLEPIRDRLFVPAFFFSLGTLVDLPGLGSLPAILGVASGFVIYALRRLLFRQILASRFPVEARAHLLVAPMLTMGAVALEALAKAGASDAALAWTMTSGLTLTLIPAFTARDGDRVLSDLAHPQAHSQPPAPPHPDGTHPPFPHTPARDTGTSQPAHG